MSILAQCLKALPISVVKICAEYAQYFDLEGIAMPAFPFEIFCVFNRETGDTFQEVLGPQLFKKMDHFFLQRGSFVGFDTKVNLDCGFAITRSETLYLRTKRGWKLQPDLGCYAGGICDSKLSFLIHRAEDIVLKIGDRTHPVENASTRAEFWRNKIIYGQRSGKVCSYSPEHGQTLLVQLPCFHGVCPKECEAAIIRKLFVLSQFSWICISRHWVAYHNSIKGLVWHFPFRVHEESWKLTGCQRIWETKDGFLLCLIIYEAVDSTSIYSEVVILTIENNYVTLKKWKTNVDFMFKMKDGSFMVFQNNTKTHHKLLSY